MQVLSVCPALLRLTVQLRALACLPPVASTVLLSTGLVLLVPMGMPPAAAQVHRAARAASLRDAVTGKQEIYSEVKPGFKHRGHSLG